ncbi:hypothetical protein [Desulfoscipio geothermicus]|nr:hypothetical protein [Desulfoscipio geothermicus]
MSFIFDIPVWKDTDGFVPALAEKWDYNREDNTYTFNLRWDTTWHDMAIRRRSPLTSGG